MCLLKNMKGEQETKVMKQFENFSLATDKQTIWFVDSC
jgi:hypothetical protein